MYLTACDNMANALDVLINEFSVDAYQKHSGRGEESAMGMVAKTTVNKSTELSQSDALSSGVISKGKGAPTVISPNAIESDAKIRNNTNKATNNIKEFNNGDLKTGVITAFAGFRRALKSAEEATTRLDNLKVAREMEAASKDAVVVPSGDR